MRALYNLMAVCLAIVLAAGCGTKNSLLNTEASLGATDYLPENPLLMKPITSSINPKKGTMATLYGNEPAFVHARTEGNVAYPGGAVLYEVTWQQQPDSVWFGANIPKEIISVERISFHANNSPVYELYSGKPLRKIAAQDTAQRTAFISSQPMAVSP